MIKNIQVTVFTDGVIQYVTNTYRAFNKLTLYSHLDSCQCHKSQTDKLFDGVDMNNDSQSLLFWFVTVVDRLCKTEARARLTSLHTGNGCAQDAHEFIDNVILI